MLKTVSTHRSNGRYWTKLDALFEHFGPVFKLADADALQACGSKPQWIAAGAIEHNRDLYMPPACVDHELKAEFKLRDLLLQIQHWQQTQAAILSRYDRATFLQLLHHDRLLQQFHDNIIPRFISSGDGGDTGAIDAYQSVLGPKFKDLLEVPESRQKSQMTDLVVLTLIDFMAGGICTPGDFGLEATGVKGDLNPNPNPNPTGTLKII